jgi:hypothetical protein
VHMRCEGLELSHFGQPRSGRQSMVFVMRHESERDFDIITLLFSVAPLSGVQLENSGVMLPKFCLDSWVIKIHALSVTFGWV